MSNNNSDEEGFFSSFTKAFKEEAEKVEKDDAPLSDKIVEGFVTGSIETIVHPVRWLRTLVKKS